MRPKKLISTVLVLSMFCAVFIGIATPAFAVEEYIYVSCMGNLEFFSAHKFGWKWGGNAWVSKRRMSVPPSMT